MLLDPDNGAISWNCAAVETATDSDKPCRAELRLGGGDGALVCLDDPPAVCDCRCIVFTSFLHEYVYVFVVSS